MNINKPTLAIYAIQDIKNTDYPQFVHDHSLVYYKKGKIEKFVQLERYTRKKYDNRFHFYLKEIIKKEGLTNPEDFDLVFIDNVLGRSFISSCGELRFEGPLSNELYSSVEKGVGWWLGKKVQAYVLNHELAHIGSCLPFFGNFKENSLLVHFDGGASLSNFSAWTYKLNKINKLDYHWRFKYLSSIFNANALTFSIIGAGIKDQNSVPGKFMGYASFGKYSEKLESWLKENHWFEGIWTKKKVFFDKVRYDFGIELNSFDLKNQFLQDIAATFHHIFVRDFTEYIIDLKNQTGADYLYLTGGSALNIVANTTIVEKGIFNEVFIPPCTNDSGLAIGAGAFFEYSKGNKVQIHSPYLNNIGIDEATIKYSLDTIKKLAELINENKVVGVCNGYAEAGPRALGNRSIICRPDSRELANKVSMEIKGREWYRPIAPVMLERNAKYFTGKNNISHLSKYMLLDFHVKEDKRVELEGATHVNGTSRIQVIYNREYNPFLYDLLDYLDVSFNIKGVINTSFNKRGEPIVHTNEDAIKSAKKMKLDALVLNGELILYM